MVPTMSVYKGFIVRLVPLVNECIQICNKFVMIVCHLAQGILRNMLYQLYSCNDV